MPIPNFNTLLSDVLIGEQHALDLWNMYTQTHRFDQEEINQALRETEKLFSGNSPQKKYALQLRAYMHQFGIGGPKDNAAAICLYDQAIGLGLADAMNNRAYMHQFGIGGPKDNAAAICLYDQAIQLGDADAMNNRAYMHHLGLGGPKDDAAAIVLYDQAIGVGHAGAMYSRAYMHQEGLGGPKDNAAAIFLYDQAIRLGHASAMYSRAYMHQEGLGGPKDYAAAIVLYDQAIGLGHAGAMNNRAYMHQHGLGGPKDDAAAICLYNQAIRLGDVDAKNAIAALLDNQKVANEEPSDTVSPFHQALSKLKTKAELLKNNGYETAYKNAMEIHDTLTQAYKTLRHDGNRPVFNKTCTDIIEKKRPVLDGHRGWSEFLINLVIAIPTLGVGLLIKGAINLAQNKSFFFVHKTETGKIVDKIQNELDSSSNFHGTR